VLSTRRAPSPCYLVRSSGGTLPMRQAGSGLGSGSGSGCSPRTHLLAVRISPCSRASAYLRGEFVVGDIGKPVKHIELEPLEVPAAPAVEPAPVVAPDREEVPA